MERFDTSNSPSTTLAPSGRGVPVLVLLQVPQTATPPCHLQQKQHLPHVVSQVVGWQPMLLTHTAAVAGRNQHLLLLVLEGHLVEAVHVHGHAHAADTHVYVADAAHVHGVAHVHGHAAAWGGEACWVLGDNKPSVGGASLRWVSVGVCGWGGGGTGREGGFRELAKGTGLVAFVA